MEGTREEAAKGHCCTFGVSKPFQGHSGDRWLRESPALTEDPAPTSDSSQLTAIPAPRNLLGYLHSHTYTTHTHVCTHTLTHVHHTDTLMYTHAYHTETHMYTTHVHHTHLKIK